MNHVRVSGKIVLKENDTIGFGCADMASHPVYSRPVNRQDLFVFQLCKKKGQQDDETNQASATKESKCPSENGAGTNDVPMLVEHRPSRCFRCV